MPANVGRKLVVKRDGAKIASMRTKSVTIGNEAIDITSDDDSGFRNLLDEPGQRQIDMSVEGLTTDDTLIDKAVNGTSLIEPYTVELPSGATITGNFRFNNLEVGAEYNAAMTFTGEFHSSGEFTFTAAP